MCHQFIFYIKSILLAFYIITGYKTSYSLTSSTHLTTSFSYSLNGSIVKPTPIPKG